MWLNYRTSWNNSINMQMWSNMITYAVSSNIQRHSARWEASECRSIPVENDAGHGWPTSSGKPWKTHWHLIGMGPESFKKFLCFGRHGPLWGVISEASASKRDQKGLPMTKEEGVLEQITANQWWEANNVNIVHGEFARNMIFYNLYMIEGFPLPPLTTRGYLYIGHSSLHDRWSIGWFRCRRRCDLPRACLIQAYDYSQQLVGFHFQPVLYLVSFKIFGSFPAVGHPPGMPSEWSYHHRDPQGKFAWSLPRGRLMLILASSCISVRIDGMMQAYAAAQTHHVSCRKIHDSSGHDAATGMRGMWWIFFDDWTHWWTPTCRKSTLKQKNCESIVDYIVDMLFGYPNVFIMFQPIFVSDVSMHVASTKAAAAGTLRHLDWRGGPQSRDAGAQVSRGRYDGHPGWFWGSSMPEMTEDGTESSGESRKYREISWHIYEYL